MELQPVRIPVDIQSLTYIVIVCQQHLCACLDVPSTFLSARDLVVLLNFVFTGVFLLVDNGLFPV